MRRLALKGEPSTVLGNLLGSIAEVFDDFREQRVETVATYTRGDGEPLALEPINESGQSVLLEGRRDLYLSWQGGEPPYTVTIIPEGSDQPDHHAAGIETPSWRFEQVVLVPGTYHVQITDAGETVAFPLQVVATEHRPGMDPSCNDATVSGELRTVTEAYCLAAIEGGQWAFEACQLLAPVAGGGYPPAALLLEGLRSGEYRYWSASEPVTE